MGVALLSTGLVALVFQSLRDRIQTGVDGEVLLVPLEDEGETLGELALAPASLAKASQRGRLLEVGSQEILRVLRAVGRARGPLHGKQSKP